MNLKKDRKIINLLRALQEFKFNMQVEELEIKLKEDLARERRKFQARWN